MSLDVYLYKEKLVSHDGGATHEKELEMVYEANITHNLNKMADAAGIYEPIWRPEEIGKTKAGQIIDLLEKGLFELKEMPKAFQKFDSPNGWGTYENFVPFVEKYLEACKDYPDAIIQVSR